MPTFQTSHQFCPTAAQNGITSKMRVSNCDDVLHRAPNQPVTQPKAARRPSELAVSWGNKNRRTNGEQARQNETERLLVHGTISNCNFVIDLPKGEQEPRHSRPHKRRAGLHAPEPIKKECRRISHTAGSHRGNPCTDGPRQASGNSGSTQQLISLLWYKQF